MITKKGINASPGVAIGPALVLDAEEYRIPRRTIELSEITSEIGTLDAAITTSRQEVAVKVVALNDVGPGGRERQQAAAAGMIENFVSQAAAKEERRL